MLGWQERTIAREAVELQNAVDTGRSVALPDAAWRLFLRHL